MAVPAASSLRVALGSSGPVAGVVLRATAGAPLSEPFHGVAVEQRDDEALSPVGSRSGTSSGGGASANDTGQCTYRIIPDAARPGSGQEPADSVAAAARQQLRSKVEVRVARAGDVVVRQGQPADQFYVIVTGECDVIRDGSGGRETLARLGPGRYFGETGLLSGVPRTASVVAATEARLLSMSRSNFRTAMAGTTPDAEALAALMLATTA